MIKVYWCVVGIVLYSLAIFGLAIPRLLSARSNELLIAGIVVVLLSALPMYFLVRIIIQEVVKSIKMWEEGEKHD